MTALESSPVLESSPSTQRRRREDWGQSRTLLNAVRMLMARPTGDEIAQELVLNLLVEHGPKSAVLSLFGPDGALHAVGAFGVSGASLDAFKTMSMWDASPMADSIRANDIVIMATSDEVTTRYPWLVTRGRAADPIAVAPLSVMNQHVGALQVTFAEQPAAPVLYADLAGLTSVIALYLSLVRSVNGPATRPGHVHAVTAQPAEVDAVPAPPPPDESPDTLTERQLDILRLMARGLTNAQIAKRIGFSDSTVRQETMAIYRVFAVGGRRDAVRMAAARGMLSDPAE